MFYSASLLQLMDSLAEAMSSAEPQMMTMAELSALGVVSFLRSVGWGTWLLDMFVLLPHGVPAVGFHVGA